MKMFFSRNKIEELKKKVENGIVVMKKHKAKKNSKEQGVLEAFEAFLIALEKLDK